MSKAKNIKKAIEILNNNKSVFYRATGFNHKITAQLITKYITANYHFKKSFGHSTDDIDREIIEYDLNLDSLINTLKQYQTIKNAIKNKRLILNCVSNNGLNWDVSYVVKNQIHSIPLIHKKTLSGYKLNYDTGAFCVSCYGTSRPLELILGFGCVLGLNFHDIPQSQQII